jgi:hypothetical protein
MGSAGQLARNRIPLNNNNRNNNRRRGRNNRGGQGGGNQGNRIDSRARGNAPQMLEKYKKLAHDASLNGDRVQTEYYLQFADHYFRVIADSRPQRDDQPQNQRGQRNDRDQDDYGNDDENEFEDASSRRDQRSFDDADEAHEGRRGSEGEEQSQDDEDNPFVGESRPARSQGRSNSEGRNAEGRSSEGRGNEGRNSEGRGNRARNGRGNGAPANDAREEEAPAGLDPASLPPSIGVSEAADDAEVARPRRRARRPRAGGDDETLEAVG